MALPSRSNPVTRSLSKVVKVISPTGIGVLLSVGAHVALLALGPRTDFSFAALSQAAQQAETEETIVPLVQLTPAERNRLPSFAQPRRPPVSGNLSLPSGLPSVPNTSILRRTVPANPFPAPTTPRTRTPVRTPTRPQTPAPLSRALPSTIPRLQLPTIPSLGLGRRSGIPVVPPANTTTPPPVETAPSEVTPPPEVDNGSARDLLPQLESAPGLSLEEAIAQQEAANQGSGSVAIGPDAEPSSNESSGADNEGEAVALPVPPPAIATASAQGETNLLLDGNNNYDATAVSLEEADEREADWLLATAEGKDAVETASSELTIDSQFKACREVPPVEGRLGVVVNPDGSQSEVEVLKSIGYDVLNRLALRTLEYEDFGTPAVPTQYIVKVNVEYKPDDCAEPLPEAGEAESSDESAAGDSTNE